MADGWVPSPVAALQQEMWCTVLRKKRAVDGTTLLDLETCVQIRWSGGLGELAGIQIHLLHHCGMGVVQWIGICRLNRERRDGCRIHII